MSGRPHPVIDGFSRHLRNQLKKDVISPDVGRHLESTERCGSPNKFAGEPGDRFVKSIILNFELLELHFVLCIIFDDMLTPHL